MHCIYGEPGSSVSMVSGYGLDDRAIEIRSRQRTKDFSSSLCVQTGSGAHPPPVQWVPGVLSSGLKRGRGVTLTTHPHLVPRSRMSRSYTFSPLSSGIDFSILLIIQSHSFPKSMLNRTSACLDYNTNPFLFPLAYN
jgi:hypothetical protein